MAELSLSQPWNRRSSSRNVLSRPSTKHPRSKLQSVCVSRNPHPSLKPSLFSLAIKRANLSIDTRKPARSKTPAISPPLFTPIIGAPAAALTLEAPTHPDIDTKYMVAIQSHVETWHCPKPSATDLDGQCFQVLKQCSGSETCLVFASPIHDAGTICVGSAGSTAPIYICDKHRDSMCARCGNPICDQAACPASGWHGDGCAVWFCRRKKHGICGGCAKGKVPVPCPWCKSEVEQAADEDED
jgi:hypothetical protein